ncbi:MAG: ATP-binding protein [Candidatus Margulisiibacteriota bacterium]
MAKKKSNYDASNIKILGGIEAVRKRPSMYIGSTSRSGLHHLIYEVVDNSVDEALAGECDSIEVVILKDNIVRVVDNGRGIPIDIHKETKRPAVEVVLTTLHAGGKFGAGGYKVSGGLHGVGVSCVNALSEWMEVEVRRDGEIYRQKFDRGIPSPEKRTKDKDTEENTGTTVTFLADKEIMDELEYDYETVGRRLQELAYLNKGLSIKFSDERGKGKSETYKYDGGVIEYVEHLNKGKDPLYKPPVYVTTEKDNVFVEVAIQHSKDYYDENLFVYLSWRCMRHNYLFYQLLH